MLSRLSAITFLVLDVDGTLTDGRLSVDEEGTHTKQFSVKDGIAIRRFVREGAGVGIISHGARAQAIEARAQMLNIAHCYVGDRPKDEVLRQWVEAEGIDLETIAIIGDDVNDLPLFACCGFGACPADAVPAVKVAADVVLTTAGGQGCVREWIDDYFFAAKVWERS